MKTSLKLLRVKEILAQNDQILLKGSNSMNLAKLVERLQEDQWPLLRKISRVNLSRRISFWGHKI